MKIDLLDRIKVLEGENLRLKAMCDEVDPMPGYLEEKLGTKGEHSSAETIDNTVSKIDHLKSLLHRCLNTGLRDDKTKPLYIEVCRVLGVDPDKPWEEK